MTVWTSSSRRSSGARRLTLAAIRSFVTTLLTFTIVHLIRPGSIRRQNIGADPLRVLVRSRERDELSGYGCCERAEFKNDNRVNFFLTLSTSPPTENPR